MSINAAQEVLELLRAPIDMSPGKWAWDYPITKNSTHELEKAYTKFILSYRFLQQDLQKLESEEAKHVTKLMRTVHDSYNQGPFIDLWAYLLKLEDEVRENNE